MSNIFFPGAPGAGHLQIRRRRCPSNIQACVFTRWPEDFTFYMESDVTQSALFYKLWAWAETHKKQVLGGAIAVVVVGLAAGLYLWWEDAKESEANAALSNVIIIRQP